MLPPKHEGPRRTCIGCRATRSQGDLIRVVWNEGRLALWSPGAVGRSAYICRDEACIRAAIKGDRLDRALRRKIGADAKDKLLSELLCGLR